MRPSFLLAAIPFTLACAQQSALRAPTLPTDQPLQVRLHQPTAGALNYTLSEPGYVAIFAVTRGHGISLLYPYYESQADHRSRAGLNQETVHGGTAGWGYTAGGRNEHRALFGFADAYYVIASKYPLPIEGMLGGPYLLRILMGADLFRATSLPETWDALESILVADQPKASWSSDVYLNWRDPFLSFAMWQPPQFLGYCNGSQVFYGSPVAQIECNTSRASLSNASVRAPIAPGAGSARHNPPRDPRDREPRVPIDAPLAAHTSLSMIRSEQSARPLQHERSVTREGTPAAAARPAEAQPQPPRQEQARAERERTADPKKN